MEPLWAVSSCIFVTILFVSSLYFVDTGLSRDHSLTVRWRIYATITVCILTFIFFYFLLLLQDGISFLGYLDLLGIRARGLILGTTCPCALVLILYTGYLVQWLTEAGWRQKLSFSRTDLMLRDYLIAPFSEEFIFRACMLAVLCLAMEPYRAVFVPPVLFGLAHLHHLMEWYRGRKSVTFAQVCASTLLQLTYTSLFGLFSAFVFVRSRHLLGVVLAHSLCNVLGLPPLDEVKYCAWKKLVALAYVLGLLLFLFFLFPLTNSQLF